MSNLSTQARFHRTAALTILACLLLLAPPAFAASGSDTTTEALPRATPEAVGLSSDRLGRIDAVMQGYVDDGRIAGAIGLVARRGKVAYLSSWGYADRENKKEMSPDALFRMYSMTKAVTGVAVMMLHEEQGFSLNTPASHWLPELGNLQVAVDRTDPDTGERHFRLEPTHRDMTVRDLLTHTSGISYAGPRDERGDFYYRRLGVNDRDQNLEEFVKKLGQAPLHNQPGTVWQYGLSMDVLGRLVEVWSGMTFDEFLEKRIFEPLGMNDTAFYAPAGKHDRLTTLYTPTQGGTIERSTSPAQDSFESKPEIFWGGAGLVSTVGDYLRFCQMLLNNGELDGVRLLGRKTVELMSADHIGDLPRVGALIGPNDGFGLTFRVVREPGLSGALGSPGEYSWGGAAGTRFWIDPQEELIGLFMIQILPHTDLTYGTDFKNLVYQAIVD